MVHPDGRRTIDSNRMGAWWQSQTTTWSCIRTLAPHAWLSGTTTMIRQSGNLWMSINFGFSTRERGMPLPRFGVNLRLKFALAKGPHPSEVDVPVQLLLDAPKLNTKITQFRLPFFPSPSSFKTDGNRYPVGALSPLLNCR